MKKLNELLPESGSIEIKGNPNILLEGVELDSRKVSGNYLFVAIKGTSSDGHDFINRAIEAGATAILCEKLPDTLIESVCYIISRDIREDLGKIAANYYDRPSEKLILIGVTGTNGKTTVATLLYYLFKELGYRVGLISTIEIMINDEKFSSDLTTPDVISLNMTLRLMSEHGCQYVFMEVSSHAAHQRRIAGVRYGGGIFTNITHDHLDYHGTFKNYISAKRSFFDSLDEDSIGIVNIDDPNGKVMVEHFKGVHRGYSLTRLTDYRCRYLGEDVYGMQLLLNDINFYTRLTGKFNAYNLLAIYACAKEFLNVDDDLIVEKMSGLSPAKGRMEVVSLHPRVVVDYAHTPDALEKVLRTLRGSMSEGRLICVAGCGGNRDVSKRPIMGKVMAANSDISIFTSDNPRFENPRRIIRDMEEKLDENEKKKVIIMEDRRSAIITSLITSHKNDTILIAGKGHEDYQEINGIREFFSDQEIIKQYLFKDI